MSEDKLNGFDGERQWKVSLVSAFWKQSPTAHRQHGLPYIYPACHHI